MSKGEGDLPAARGRGPRRRVPHERRRGRRGRRSVLHRHGRANPGHRRGIGLRKDGQFARGDGAARPDGADHARRHQVPRHRPAGAAGQGPSHLRRRARGDGVPGRPRRPQPGALGWLPAHRGAAGAARHRPRRGSPPSDRAARPRQGAESCRPDPRLPAPVLRWHAPTGDDRRRPGDGPGGTHRRRADDRPGRDRAGAGACACSPRSRPNDGWGSC